MADVGVTISGAGAKGDQGKGSNHDPVRNESSTRRHARVRPPSAGCGPPGPHAALRGRAHGQRDRRDPRPVRRPGGEPDRRVADDRQGPPPDGDAQQGRLCPAGGAARRPTVVAAAPPSGHRSPATAAAMPPAMAPPCPGRGGLTACPGDGTRSPAACPPCRGSRRVARASRCSRRRDAGRPARDLGPSWRCSARPPAPRGGAGRS